MDRQWDIIPYKGRNLSLSTPYMNSMKHPGRGGFHEEVYVESVENQ